MGSACHPGEPGAHGEMPGTNLRLGLLPAQEGLAPGANSESHRGGESQGGGGEKKSKTATSKPSKKMRPTRKTPRKTMRHDLTAIAGKKDDTMEAAEIRAV